MQPTTRYYDLSASEFDWKLSGSKTIKAWGYNNTLPGPVLRAKKGDTMVIRFRNNLHQPTIVHWHGIRLPASMDGNGEVQQPVQPGETFEYRFAVPDAGTFWYHSHHDETVQMERGMYGALVVEDDADPVTDGEKVLMLDDMKLTSSNEFKKGGFLERWKERHDGREGTAILINGKENPVITMQAGQVERWRLVNASSARYFQLYLGGKPFRIIGTDGGLIENPVTVTKALITPGERIDILVGPFERGNNFELESLPYNRMTFVRSKRQAFAKVKVGETAPSIANIPAKLRNIELLAPQNAAVNRKVKFSVGASFRHGIDFLVNNALHAHDRPVMAGELQVWEVANTSLMDHPFHLHGFFFHVLEVNGKEPAFRSWKDTVNLPPRSRVKIAWMPDDRPGSWMYHCHILEHHAAGMMGHFEVFSGQGAAMAHKHHH
jgi:FtsP/CotA-like multicopper oxidase with cupredoxin domain